jgi:hypothetical protein
VQGKARSSDVSTQDYVVRECLDRILASPAFRTSGRAKQFLSFVVLRTLEGRREEIKERTIGAEVFGRIADFETSGDSIVRVNANEVRRRLAQYYHDAAPPDPVQIVLPPGTYIPEFVGRPLIPIGTTAPAVTAPDTAGLHRRGAFWWLIAAAATVAAGAGMVSVVIESRPTEFDRFWAPITSLAAAPVLSLPASDTFQLAAGTAEELKTLKPGQFLKLTPGDIQSFHNWHTSLPVLQAVLNISSVLQRGGKVPLMRIGADLKMDELRGHPVIAIGSFANPWTRQNVAGLRFTFDRGASDKEPPRIRDARNPARSWSLARVYPQTQDKDYAIVTRTFDPATGEPFLSLAGLHSFGCQIGGEFVSQPSLLQAMASRAPAGWEKMNFQVVLETSLIGTTPSSPKIADAFFWK